MVAILANGDFPGSENVLRRLAASARIICCDGAAGAALAAGLRIDAVVGDGDSLGDGLKARLAGVWRKVDEQETNDLAKAFRFAVGEGADRIEIFGASGKREDHLIGNVFHLLGFNEGGVRTDMVTDHGVFTVVRAGETRSFNAPKGTPVSVFAPVAGTAMKSRGLAWPLDGVKFDTLWRGTLNRTDWDVFEIWADAPAIVFIASI